MSGLKDGMTEITLDKPRKLLFDLNVIEILNDKFGGYDKLNELMNPEKCKEYATNIKYLLTLLLNEAAEYQNIVAGETVEPLISERFLGMLINPSVLVNDAPIAIINAFNTGMSGASKPETVDEDDEDGMGPTKAATESSTM